MAETSNYDCAVEIRDAIRRLTDLCDDNSEVIGVIGDVLAQRVHMPRVDLVCRIVCAYIASASDGTATCPLGSRIEDRRTICLLAGLWADSILAEALGTPAREP